MATFRKLTEILVPLRAPTPETLSKKMFENNIKDSTWYNYADPTFANGQWVTWYMKDIENEIALVPPTPIRA